MNILKLRDSVMIVEESDSIYQAVFTSSRRIKRFGIDELGKELIEYLKETRSEVEIFTHFSKYGPETIRTYIDSLRKLNLVSEQGKFVEPRHLRQVTFIGELTYSTVETQDLQKRITDSKVAVFGVGGIGGWIVNGLAQLGVQEIRISDTDIVEESNLNRQLFFTSKDIGRYKVDVIKEKIPDSNIKTYKTRVAKDISLDEIIDGANFIINCADSPSVAETSRIIDSYARPRKIAYSIAGGYNMHLGMVGPIIIPGVSACFDCFLEHQKSNDPLKNMKMIKDVEQTGNLGAMAGAIANLHVMDFFKFKTGKGTPNINKFAEINFMDLSIEWRNFASRPDCPTCGKV